MKKLVGLLIAMFLAAPCASNAFAENDGESVGDYASAMKSTAPIHPGHFALIAARADDFLNEGPGGARTIYAATLVDGIDDPAKADELDDFYLLDIRRKVDFDAKHIEGAVHVEFQDVANPGVLSALPTDKPILVICYTGHTASVATGILGVLGYDVWTLRFGMTSWYGSTSTKVWSPSASQYITGGNYPVVP